MKLRVHKAYDNAPKATITLSRTVRDAIQAASGKALKLGYAASVKGDKEHCPRNLIVQCMRRDDPLLNKGGVARIGSRDRSRLGIDIGDCADVEPLSYETWYHGTRAPDPVNSIIKGKWIVGGSGAGVWMSNDINMAMGYALVALLTLEVAWGQQLQWPLGPNLLAEFNLWCREHNVDSTPSIDRARGWTWNVFQPIDNNIIRWARLYGHYFVPYSRARIFPGITGESFKGNRVRIMKAVTRDGRVLYQRQTRSAV